LAAEPSSSELAVASAAARLLQQFVGPGAHRRLVLAFGLQQDVAGPHPALGGVLGLVLVVEGLDVGLRHLDALAYLVDLDQGVAHLALLADAVGLLVGVEPGLDLGGRHRHLVAEPVGGESDQLELHLLVAALELGGDFGVRHRHPAGDRSAQLLLEDGAAQLVFELACRQRHRLAREQLPIAGLADEHTVLHEGGQRQDALAHLDVAHAQVLTPGLDGHGLLVDERLQDLLVDAELAQHRLADLPAVRLAVGLQLRGVAALELSDRDGLALDVGQHLVGRHAGGGGAVVWHEEEGEREDDEREAPLEPALVPPHPIEHRHWSVSSNPSS
jgi:hypothetical protein